MVTEHYIDFEVLKIHTLDDSLQWPHSCLSESAPFQLARALLLQVYQIALVEEEGALV